MIMSLNLNLHLLHSTASFLRPPIQALLVFLVPRIWLPMLVIWSFWPTLSRNFIKESTLALRASSSCPPILVSVAFGTILYFPLLSSTTTNQTCLLPQLSTHPTWCVIWVVILFFFWQFFLCLSGSVGRRQSFVGSKHVSLPDCRQLEHHQRHHGPSGKFFMH